MSAWLDGEAAVVRLVAADLGIGRVRQTGRHGLSADAALRCALLKQYFQLSYEELAFLLSDSASLRAFARLPFGWSPKKSALHSAIGAIAAATFECLNRMLLARAANGQAGERRQGPVRQHGRRDRHPCAHRLQPVVGCRAGHGAAVASSRRRAARLALARPHAPGQEARPRPSSTVVATTGSGCTASCSPRPARRSPICTTPWRGWPTIPRRWPRPGAPRPNTSCR